MEPVLLHVVDALAGADALATLALLLQRNTQPQAVLVLGDGHLWAALPEPVRRACVGRVRTLGWADPAGWLALLRRIDAVGPLAGLHIWGLRALASVALRRWSVPLVLNPGGPYNSRQRSLLRLLVQRCGATVVAQSQTEQQILQTASIPGVQLIPLPCPLDQRPDRATVRSALGVPIAAGPVLWLAGHGRGAGHELGLWAAGIFQQLEPQTCVLVRADSSGLARFSSALAHADTIHTVLATTSDFDLAAAADIVLFTPTQPAGVMGILAAIALTVPVVVTPQPVATEYIAQGQTGWVAKSMQPRQIAARLEACWRMPAERELWAGNARAQLFAQHKPSAAVAEYRKIYLGSTVTSPV
ncbi:MAG: glycosyltransferase [Phycisphaerae bacterium]